MPALASNPLKYLAISLLRFMALSRSLVESQAYFRNKRMPLPTTSRLAPMSANTAAHIVA